MFKGLWDDASRLGYNASSFNVNGSRRTVRTYSTTYLQRKASDYLDYFEKTDEDPWFMQVSPYAPHEPAIPEKKYAHARVGQWSGNPAQEEADLSDKPDWVLAGAEDDSGSARELPRKQLRTLMSVDDLVAATFAKLNALEETEVTLVFFPSDNGWHWYEHQLNGKRYPYDESVRVPFYVRWPGHVEAGAVEDKIVANIDIAPTVYEAAGIEPDYTVDGRDLLTSNRSQMLTEYLHYPASGVVPNWRSLWTPTSTYIRYDGGEHPRELYRSGDPWQLTNVYRDGLRHNEPKRRSRTRRIARRLCDLRRRGMSLTPI